jgi:hypothetical protein
MRKYQIVFNGIALLLMLALLAPLAGCGGKAEAVPTPTATIAALSGEVLVQVEGLDNWIAAVLGMKLNQGDRIKTGADGAAEVVLFEGSVVEVGEKSEILLSEMSITGPNGTTSINLQQSIGHSINRVKKLVNSASSYEVETPAGTAVVRGTIFKAYVEENGYTVIYSEEGDIWFAAGGVTVVVGAGKQSGAMPGGTPSEPSLIQIENAEICSDVIGDRDYTVQPDAIFNAGDTVWIYFEAYHLDWNYSGGTYEVWYRADNVDVYAPDGELYMTAASPFVFHGAGLDEIPEYLWGALYIDLPSSSPEGQYKVEILFVDMLSDLTDSITVHFTAASSEGS